MLVRNKINEKCLASSLFSKKGMSLVEVLIAVGIGSIAIYLLSSVVLQGFSQSVKLSVKQENRDATEELKMMVKSPACGIERLKGSTSASASQKVITLSSASFFDQISSNASNVSKVFNEITLNGSTGDGLANESIAFSKGMIYGKLKVSDVRIMPLLVPTSSAAAYAYDFVGSDSVRAQLYVAFQSQAGEKPTGIISSRYPVILRLDPSHTKIINCSSVEELAATQQTCEAFKGTWDSNSGLCDLGGNMTDTGTSLTCAVNDSCNVTSDYQL